MTGPTRRAFEAEMTLTYYGGNSADGRSRLWVGRQTVARGLAENEPVSFVLGLNQPSVGRKRWEERHPQVAEALRQLADAHAQQDPTFRTSVTSTRLTAQAALKALSEQG